MTLLGEGLGPPRPRGGIDLYTTGVQRAKTLNGGFPTVRVPFLGIPIIRIIVFWCLYWVPLILGNYQIWAGKMAQAISLHDVSLLSTVALSNGSGIALNGCRACRSWLQLGIRLSGLRADQYGIVF